MTPHVLIPQANQVTVLAYLEDANILFRIFLGGKVWLVSRELWQKNKNRNDPKQEQKKITNEGIGGKKEMRKTSEKRMKGKETKNIRR